MVRSKGGLNRPSTKKSKGARKMKEVKKYGLINKQGKLLFTNYNINVVKQAQSKYNNCEIVIVKSYANNINRYGRTYKY